jgi:hypothetical protein
MKTLRVVRDLGVRASVIALLVAATGSATHRVSQWQHRRAAAATHRQAGWL